MAPENQAMVSLSQIVLLEDSFLGESPESMVRDSLGDIQHPNNASKKEKKSPSVSQLFWKQDAKQLTAWPIEVIFTYSPICFTELCPKGFKHPE